MPEVCLVVPCFNEERRLPSAAIVEYLNAHPHVHMYLVDDGSLDRTFAKLEELRGMSEEQVVVCHLPVNRGKAQAVRHGVLETVSRGRFPFIGYWDADLSTPLDEVDRLLQVLVEDTRRQLAMACRVKRLGSHIDRRMIRHVLGRILASTVRMVLGLSVYDSQCGAKVFRCEAAAALFAEPFLTRWLFDLELLARLQTTEGFNLDAAIEVPVGHWREVNGSKLRWRDLAIVPVDLLRIRRAFANRPMAASPQRPGNHSRPSG